MSRVVLLTLVLMAVYPQTGLGAPVAVVPEPSSLPPYVSPRLVLDETLKLPPGESPEVGADRVCYGPASHLRLTLSLQLAQGLSDERARASWLYGWSEAKDVAAQAFDEEHAARLKAEADANAYDARLQASERSGWRDAVISLLGAALAGAALGYIVGSP